MYVCMGRMYVINIRSKIFFIQNRRYVKFSSYEIMNQ